MTVLIFDYHVLQGPDCQLWILMKKIPMMRKQDQQDLNTPWGVLNKLLTLPISGHSHILSDDMDLSWTYISDSSCKDLPTALKLAWGSQGALTQRLSHSLHQQVGLSHKCRLVKSIMMTVNRFVADRIGLNWRKKVLQNTFQTRRLSHSLHPQVGLSHRCRLLVKSIICKLPLPFQKCSANCSNTSAMIHKLLSIENFAIGET